MLFKSWAHMAYDHGGIKVLKPKPNGGRKHENMTLAEEKALLARFHSPAQSVRLNHKCGHSISCARLTVLSDTPRAAAIAGCVNPLSRNSTIWMRWRCAAGIFQHNAVFTRRTSALLHLTICFPRIRWRKRTTAWGRKTVPHSSPRSGAYLQKPRFKPFWRWSPRRKLLDGNARNGAPAQHAPRKRGVRLRQSCSNASVLASVRATSRASS